MRFPLINKKFLKDHLPEILTGMSVFGTVVSDALFVYAAKKEQIDHNKKHYILPIVTSTGSIVCIIASNRVSNSQKTSILAGVTVLAANYYNYQNATKEVLTDEQKESLDELLVMANDAYPKDDAFIEGDKELYFLPQFGILFLSITTLVNMYIIIIYTSTENMLIKSITVSKESIIWFAEPRRSFRDICLAI